MDLKESRKAIILFYDCNIVNKILYDKDDYDDNVAINVLYKI